MLVLMILWRVWHVHNELTHGKTMIPIIASRRFLCEYIDSLLMIKHYPQMDIAKGKRPVDLIACHMSRTPTQACLATDVLWEPPLEGYVKLNFDGSFVAAIGEVGAGMILRNRKGHAIFAACRWLFNCGMRGRTATVLALVPSTIGDRDQLRRDRLPHQRWDSRSV